MTTFVTRANERQITLYPYGLAAASIELNPRMNGATAEDIATAPYIVEEIEVTGEVTPERYDRPFGGGSYTDLGTRSGMLCSMTIRCFNSLDLQTLQQNLMALLYNDFTGTMVSALDGAVLRFGYSGTDDLCSMRAIRLVADPAVKMEGNTYVVQVVIGSDLPFLVNDDITISQSAPLTTGGSGFSIPLTIPFTLVASSGGDANPADVSTMRESFSVLRVYGPITNPVVTMSNTVLSSKQLRFSGSIAQGDYWTIDLWSKRVFANDSAKISALTVASSEWFGIPRTIGTTTISVSGSGFNAQTKLTIENVGAIA